MKTLKRNAFIKAFAIVLAVLFLGACKKDSSDDGGNDPGKGSFKLKGNEYSGICTSIPATSGVSGNIDVLITTSSGTAVFAMYNMPKGSSGTTQVVNFDDEDVAFSSSLYAICTIYSGNNVYYSTSGTVTKTSSNSFNFSINLYDPIEEENVTITGSGKY
ncbi:hypothetical protein ACFQZX_18145 [Mucilaginibacter litoreus]|uniref:Lipocalin-like domain-containing protein n=1 Tax=Mucilaginibacter litoreus TaxID=1048221 RepID=A0ABW3AXM6_9SPHI